MSKKSALAGFRPLGSIRDMPVYSTLLEKGSDMVTHYTVDVEETSTYRTVVAVPDRLGEPQARAYIEEYLESEQGAKLVQKHNAHGASYSVKGILRTCDPAEIVLPVPG